ncbi:hypothetical protein SRABI91_01097 [Rhodococcoides fascians]|nr:hypothetical protein SRABI91_01097 [Rhodococcus fascians]
MTVSTLSAMTSRETNEKCMPSWPIEMPSDTEMVPNSNGYPPAAWTPFLTSFASRSSERLQGVISFHDDATPIWDLTQSSSPIPTARSMPRAAVFSSPSVTSRLRGLTSTSGGLCGVVMTLLNGRRWWLLGRVLRFRPESHSPSTLNLWRCALSACTGMPSIE